jgi:hypothetical protein
MQKERVYFIKSLDSNLILIGRSPDVARKLRELKTETDEVLVLLASEEGNEKKEEEYHRKFFPLRVHGKWYSPGRQLMAQIKKLTEKKENNLEFDRLTHKLESRNIFESGQGDSQAAPKSLTPKEKNILTAAIRRAKYQA